MKTDRPVLLVLTEGGLATAERLAAQLPGAEIHGLAKRLPAADHRFEDTIGHLQGLFRAGRPVVGLCAAGILIRALAPLLTDKTAEPPVLALAEDGSAVVPLLGGHHGANRLARDIADLLGISAAITTAGDLHLGFALDDPPPGWRLANPDDHKAFMASLLAGEGLRVEGEAPWLDQTALANAAAGSLTLRVTDGDAQAGPDRLVYHPQVLALGVGCERGAAPDELIALARETLAAAGLTPGAVAGVFSLDLKTDEPAMHALANALGVPARFFPAAVLEAEAPRLANPSDLVFAEVGCHGVAEGAALAAAGPQGVLVQPKRKSRRCTCAIARAPKPLDATVLGRPRGRLVVAGLGPGDSAWRTAEVDRILRQADDLVGYGFYLDLAGPPRPDQRRHDFALGEEELRARKALVLAAEGREVVLLSSGDPGIYAMATLVFELLEAAQESGEEPAWLRPEVVVMPGISALQAAAARVGAPLGHDFCAISLSDLLTPWPVIEQRLEAAAAGDFVLALYNPVSRRRRVGFEKALAILRAARPADTPVVLGRQLGRPEESVTVTTLAETRIEDVDMLTLVMVGSSATRRVARGSGGTEDGCWVYTPRGYAAKRADSRTEKDGAA